MAQSATEQEGGGEEVAVQNALSRPHVSPGGLGLVYACACMRACVRVYVLQPADPVISGGVNGWSAGALAEAFCRASRSMCSFSCFLAVEEPDLASITLAIHTCILRRNVAINLNPCSKWRSWT